MQLNVADLRPKVKAEQETPQVDRVRLEDLPNKSDTPLVLRDECRVREGDILPPEPVTPQVRTPTALRGIALNKITSRAELLCALTHNLPRNDYNMPKVIYRPDLLDPSVFHCESEQTDKFQAMQDLLEASTITLSYHEGYPALPKGEPIWAKFDWESAEDYDFFNQYLHLPGARQLQLLTPAAQMRFSELFHVNYWALRCLASDTFAVVHHQRVREQRILSTDDKHFLQSEAMLQKLFEMVASVDWAALQGDPKQFVEVMERLTKIQRAALGHAAQGGGNKENQGVQSVEVLLRQATEKGIPQQEYTPEGLDIHSLLQDPASVERAQELILRVGMK